MSTPASPHAGVAPSPLVTSRNNCDIAFSTAKPEGVFRLPRPYVGKCLKGTLSLYYEGGRVKFRALACGSWSCPHCRKALAARTLDRLRRGLEGRDGLLSFVTLTVNPADFGGRVEGYAYYALTGARLESSVPLPYDDLADAGMIRRTRLYLPPTLEQYKRVCKAMSAEFKRLRDRLNLKAKRLGHGSFGHFRIIELHRNGWPHYHVLFDHEALGADDIEPQVKGWVLGRVDVRAISLDDAVGELAPYLTSPEYKGAGSKAYQFAASALPKHFKLHTSSKGFLAPRAEVEQEKPLHSLILRGYFTSFRDMLPPEDVTWIAPPPAAPDRPHRAPASFIASGDAAVVLYSELAHQSAIHMPPSWLQQVKEFFVLKGTET